MMIFENVLLTGFFIFYFAEVCFFIILRAMHISAIITKLINMFSLDNC